MQSRSSTLILRPHQARWEGDLTGTQLILTRHVLDLSPWSPEQQHRQVGFGPMPTVDPMRISPSDEHPCVDQVFPETPILGGSSRFSRFEAALGRADDDESVPATLSA